MNIVVVKNNVDSRVSLVPDSVKKLLRLDDVEVAFEKNISDIFTDQEYINARAKALEREKALKLSNLAWNKLLEDSIEKESFDTKTSETKLLITDELLMSLPSMRNRVKESSRGL